MRIVSALVLLGVAAGAGCGTGKDGIGRYGPQAASLEVVVRPEGPGGPASRTTIRCARLGPGAPGSPECADLDGLTAGRLAPTPAARACAAIFGGPATALVRSVIEGVDVDARFTLTNACEIQRWRRNSALLGRPPLRR